MTLLTFVCGNHSLLSYIYNLSSTNLEADIVSV